MTNFRDGGALSFTPAARKSRTLSRVVGATLIIAALAGAYFLFQHDRNQYPALVTGHTDTGILNGYQKVGGRTYASIVLLDASKTARNINSRQPVQTASKNDLGRSFTVHYLDQKFSDTFIEGIDHVDYTVGGYAILAGGVIVGLGLIIVPFKVRTRR